MGRAEQGIADDEAARLAAIQRATRGGALGQGSAPEGPLPAPGTAIGSDITAGLNPGVEAGTSTVGTVAGQNDAIARAADLARQATAGGPPPGFTGTFNGKAYSGGQLVSPNDNTAAAAAGRQGSLGTGGPTSVPTVTPQAAATSGSLGPTSVPTGTGGPSGSLTSALVPPTATGAGTSNVTTVTDGGGMGGATSIAEKAAPGAGTTNINGPQLADKAMVNGVEVWAGGPNSGQPTATTSGELTPAGGAPGGSGDLGAVTSGIMNQLQQIQQSLSSPGTSTDVTATYMKSAQSILAMLDQQEAQLKADNAKQGTTIDPATQFTIDKLRETLDDNLKTMKEDLNRRGLSDSGIQLELENRLTKGSASDQAGILADRLSKLQDQLQQGLSSIRSQKYSTANQYGLAAANAQSSWDENTRKLAQDREQAALSGMLSLRGQMSTAQNARLSEIAATGRATASDTAAMARALVNEQGANSRNAATIANSATQDEANRQNAITLENMRRAGVTASSGGAAGRAAAGKTPTAAQGNAATVQAAQAAINNDYQTSGDAISAVQARQAQIVAQVGTAGYNAILQHAASLPTGRNGSNY